MNLKVKIARPGIDSNKILNGLTPHNNLKNIKGNLIPIKTLNNY
jgi:hypothetical protein